MDIQEAQLLKNKALQTLVKYNTVASLQWFMDQPIQKLESLGVTYTKEKEGIEVVNKSLRFVFNKNNYELIFANGRSFYTPGGDAFMGDFLLYFNEVLV